MNTSSNESIFAHTLAGHGPAHWEQLDRHLDDVARLSRQFADAFDAADWGNILGRCHDLGKASTEFQTYLHLSNAKESENAGVEDIGGPRRVNHSNFGARYVASLLPGVAGQMLAYCIAGHHGGLPDAQSSDDALQRGTLEARLDQAAIPIPYVPDPQMARPALALPFKPEKAEFGFSLAFLTRMLFSCLVDADRTCTEGFCNPQQAQERLRPRPDIAQMQTQLQDHLDELRRNVAPPSPVNALRQQVLQECRSAACLAPGFFSLQVPTGGGKTLSSLAFALDHAITKDLRRVIFAIPFTSIVDQTAKVFRDALGAHAELGLVEHHTNLQPERRTRANELGAENWDAPLIVTTNVQMFESLFAAATTPCRKLHRLAKSVIILDEAQVLPVELLIPTLTALRELVAHYGCTVVLCTATQPALERREGFSFGIEGVRPIIADPQRLFDALKRVRVERAGTLSDELLARRIAAEDCALAIVNTRGDAARLFQRVSELAGPEHCFHLSTMMCGAHRRAVLDRIREQVKRGPCRVVSTQLVEAGVDLDFPVVYRAETGFDSIAQAAGRCNREGKLAGLGVTYVFKAEQPPPRGTLRRAAATASELFPHRGRRSPRGERGLKLYGHDCGFRFVTSLPTRGAWIETR